MSREARFLNMWLMSVIVAVATGCAHKPAYSEMDTNRATANRNESSSNANKVAAPGPSSQPSSTEPATPSPDSPVATPTSAPPKRPSFLDEAKGGVKDLPSYPGAQRVSVQIGPVQGFNTMSLGLRTTDSMEKITAFYEQVIKANKWTVVDKLIDPELSEWVLKKGEGNSAKVQVKKDLKTSTMNIVIVRGEKLEETAK